MLIIGIAAESRSEASLVSRLGDRVILALADWLDAQLDVGRRWAGLGAEVYVDLHGVNDKARARGVRKLGHFGGEPGAVDAFMIRNLFALLADEDEPPAVVVVARDTDGDWERRAGFQQAVDAAAWPFVAVSAHAHPEREGWLLAAFEPADPHEHHALAEVKQQLGFDPTARPEELNFGDDSSKRNAKRVLALLCPHDDACARLTDASLERLRARGTTCGLTAFLVDFDAAIAPHLGVRRRAPS